MAYVAVSVLYLFLTYPHTLFLWRMWLSVFCVSSFLIHILTSYGVCGCQCSVSLSHSFTYSLLMAYVAVNVLFFFLTQSYSHFLWRMWLLVCCVSLPHSITYSLLMAYVAVSVLCFFLTHSHTHFLWRMWLLVFCVSSSLFHILTSYGVCGCQCPVFLPHSIIFSLLMAYVAVSVLCLFLTHFLLTPYGVCGCQWSVSPPHSFTYSLLMAHVAVSVLCPLLTHSHTHFLWRMWLLVSCFSSSLNRILTSYGVCGCQCSMSLPHSFTSSLLRRMWLLVFCVSSSLIYILTSYGVCHCQCSVSLPHTITYSLLMPYVSLPHSFTYSLLMAYVAVSVLCLFLTHFLLTPYGVCGCQCSLSLPHSFTHTLLIAYVDVRVLCLFLTHSHTHFLCRMCLFLTHSHTHFLWRMWLLAFCVSSSLIFYSLLMAYVAVSVLCLSSLIHILTSYGVCGCQWSVSLPHSFTYSLLMAYVAVSVLCILLTHSHTHFLWRKWLLVFCVSSSLIHILTSYGVCGCQCSVSPPHSFTYSLLMVYVAVNVLCFLLTHSHTHFLWRMWLLVFCVSSSLTHILTSYGVCGCQCSVSPPHSFTYSLLMAYVAVSVLCLFLTHFLLTPYGVCGCQCSVSPPHSFTYSLLMAYVVVSHLCLFLTHSHTHFLWRMWLLVLCISSSLIHILTPYGVCGCQCSVSLPHSFTYSLLMAYVAVSVLCLFLTHFLLTSYGVCGCQCSVSPPHSLTYSLLMAYVVVSGLCLFLTHSHTHSLWRMWLLVFCVSSSLIHILTPYGVCGCQCSVSLPHSLTYSLLMVYVVVSVLFLFLTL